jgi:tetratricopeptide (TPR) repeat protein
LPNSGPGRMNLASEVLAFYREIVSQHPADPDMKYELGNSCRIAANIGRSMGDEEATIELYNEGLGLLGTLVVENPGSDDYRIGLALAHVDSGEHKRMAGKPRAAESEQLRALEILQQAGAIAKVDERYHRIEAVALFDLASARLAMGRPLEALPQARKAVELLRPLVERPTIRNDDRIYYIYGLLNKAIANHESGHPVEARNELDEAARRTEEIGSSSTDALYAHALIQNERGRILAESGKAIEAEAAYHAAFSELFKLFLSNNRVPFIEREIAVARNGRGGARLAALGTSPDREALVPALEDCTKARDYLTSLVQQWPGHYDYHSQLGRALANLGRIARLMNQEKASCELMTQAITCHQRASKLNPDSPDDKKLEAAIRDELKTFEAGRARVSP